MNFLLRQPRNPANSYLFVLNSWFYRTALSAPFAAVTVLTPTQLNAGLAKFRYAPFAGRLGVETSSCGIETSA